VRSVVYFVRASIPNAQIIADQVKDLNRWAPSLLVPCIYCLNNNSATAIVAAVSRRPATSGGVLARAAVTSLSCCRAEARHDVSVFFIPDRSILCERLLKQASKDRLLTYSCLQLSLTSWSGLAAQQQGGAVMHAYCRVLLDVQRDCMVLQQEGVYGDIVIGDIPVDWVPYDTDILSLEREYVFRVQSPWLDRLRLARPAWCLPEDGSCSVSPTHHQCPTGTRVQHTYRFQGTHCVQEQACEDDYSSLYRIAQALTQLQATYGTAREVKGVGAAALQLQRTLARCCSARLPEHENQHLEPLQPADRGARSLPAGSRVT
jgi:Sec1 family